MPNTTGKLPINWKEYTGEDRVITSHEMDLLLKEEGQNFVNVKSKIPALDRAVGGFRDGELISISGPTKQGKTLICQTMTVEFCKQNQFPLWFSFEVPPRQFLSQFDELPYILMPRVLKPHALKWVEERITESFCKYRTRVVFLDHLHYLFDLARTRNPSIEIGTVIRRLKGMAVREGFLIFLLCHTTKGRGDENLSYDSIRDSSFVAQESDCVLMIKRTPELKENYSSLRVEFHRRTGVIEKLIELEKVNGFLRERTNRQNNWQEGNSD